ncbi:MAG: assimilatory nitrate reductase catalytic subunit [Candidatus Azotimanducaceae bacterium]|jgi:assimilatory nitrate reductase catalytic subunit
MAVTTSCTTCPYCGVGCGVLASVSNNELVTVVGDPAHPANHGRLCVKGSTLVATQSHETRLLHPVVDGIEADWDTAITEVAGRFQQTIEQFGPDSVAFYLSGQLLTEDYYVANKLIKGFIGSANVDTNSRLCMASAVAAHKRAFGEDVVCCDYSDLDVADLIVLVGSNAAWAHPVAYQRMVQAVESRGAEIVVIDPRVTSTCDIAELHLQIKPGSDTVLFNGLLTYLNQNSLCDLEFMATATENSAASFAAAEISLSEVAQATGVAETLITRFYDKFGATKKTVTVFSQGINQSVSGTDNANAIINCHLATGRIGIAGAGPFSITGQPNAMGGREVGGMANQLAAHMDFQPEHVKLVEGFWGAPNMATAPGMKAVELFEKMAEGKIKAVWIMATNPAVSLPDTHLVKKALTLCDFVVVSETVKQTDTSVFADVLLPACGWAEKDGTVTNSERCVSRQRELIVGSGLARPDWAIITEVARAMGFESGFPYASVVEIFREHAALSGYQNSGGRLFDISHLKNITEAEYQQLQPFSWPLSHKPFADRQFSTSTGKAQFVATTPGQIAQKTTAEYPFVLNTGRLRDQWHSMTRTGTTAKLFAHQSQPLLEINPLDAEALGVTANHLVQVKSQQGTLTVRAKLTENVQVGHLFLPIHWSDQFSSVGSVGQLFGRAVDPISGQPELKHGAVNLQLVTPHLWVNLFTQDKLPELLLRQLEYWNVSPGQFGGWEYESAFSRATSTSIIEQLAGLYGACQTTDYKDLMSTSQRRFAVREGRLMYALSIGPVLAELAGLVLPDQVDGDRTSWRTLAGVDTDVRSSPLVCTCFEVSESTIATEILAGCDSLDQLGVLLKCGTNCGSCIPELNQMLKQYRQEPESEPQYQRVKQ